MKIKDMTRVRFTGSGFTTKSLTDKILVIENLALVRVEKEDYK